MSRAHTRAALPAAAILVAALVLAGAGDAAAAGPSAGTPGPPAGVPRPYAGRMVKLPSGDETIDAYLSVPPKPARGVVVVVHEWWGLNAWVKKVANRYASQGYVAIAPDLYRGKVAADAELAHELSRGLPQERAVRDIRAARAYLDTLREGAGRPGGVIGFCMGGGLALRAALDSADFRATVTCYGSVIGEPEKLRTLRGPVLGVFGADDRGIGVDQTQALERGLREAGNAGAVRVYKGVGHAFLNEERPGYQADVARQAWSEIDSFLLKNVAGP
jgi:carboxymethylenebutenolidase